MTRIIGTNSKPIVILPHWLKDEMAKDETIKELVTIGQERGKTLEEILDGIGRFLLDREVRILKHLYKYKELYGDFPTEKQ